MDEKLTKIRLERPQACRAQYRTNTECLMDPSDSLRTELSNKSNICIQSKEKEKSEKEEKVTEEVVAPPRKSD